MKAVIASVTFGVVFMLCIILVAPLFKPNLPPENFIVVKKWVSPSWEHRFQGDRYELYFTRHDFVYVSSEDFKIARIGEPYTGSWVSPR